MEIEFSDNDFSDSEVEVPTPAEPQDGTRFFLRALSLFSMAASPESSIDLSEAKPKKKVREPAVASDSPPSGIVKKNKLCVDRTILSNYRTIGFTCQPNPNTIFLIAIPEGKYFAEGRRRPGAMCPGKDDPLMPRVFFILLDEITLELCQFDISYTISIESYTCSCNVPWGKKCTKKKTKMAFVGEGKSELAPRCLLYRANASSPPSVRQWYPQDADKIITHHNQRKYFRYSFQGTGLAVEDADDDDGVELMGGKTYIDESHDAGDGAETANDHTVSSKAQRKSEKLRARIQHNPYVSAHELVTRIDTSLFYERVLGRTMQLELRKNTTLREDRPDEVQAFVLVPALQRFFRTHGEAISVSALKMETALRVARLINAAYQYDPYWKHAVKSRRGKISIDDGSESSGPGKDIRPTRMPIAFVLAFAFWESHEDLFSLPKNEPPPLEWPGGGRRPAFQLGFAVSNVNSAEMSKVLPRAPINPRQVGMARNPSAASDCILKFSRRNNRRLPYLYAGRLDADASDDRKKIVRVCRHYGFNIPAATLPFRKSKINMAYVREAPDKVRFMRFVALLSELSKSSAAMATSSYDRISDVDARGASCDVPMAAPKRVALQVVSACAITRLPGVQPTVLGVCKTYENTVRFLKTYTQIRDMNDPEAAATTVKAPGELQFERIKAKRVVFTGHEAVMEMFSRHFHWNSKDRETFESILVRTGVFLDAVSYCHLRKFEKAPVTVGTKQFRDAFEALGVKEPPPSFFDAEREATAETAQKTCIPAEIIAKKIHFEWTGSPRIEEAVKPKATTNARFFVLYDDDTWNALTTMRGSMLTAFENANVRLSGEMLSVENPDRPNEMRQMHELITKLSSIDDAGSLMVVVPQALGNPYVEKIRSAVRNTYGTIDESDEFDRFFNEGQFVVQTHEIKDSIASSRLMKGCDIVLVASHLLGLREFLDIVSKIIRETLPSRVAAPGARPEKTLTIHLAGFVYGNSPQKKSALSELLRGNESLTISAPIDPKPETMMQALTNCSVVWVGHDIEATEASAKRARPALSYMQSGPRFSCVPKALKMKNAAIIATKDPYAPLETLQSIDPDFRRVYIDAFVKVSRYGRPTLRYGSKELLETKQENEKFWTGATFLRSVNDFPGHGAELLDPNTNIVVSLSVLALEYSCANPRQLLWLLGRARVVILTDVGKKRGRFSDLCAPEMEEGQAFVPYAAAEEFKRKFSGSTFILTHDKTSSVERYLSDLFHRL